MTEPVALDPRGYGGTYKVIAGFLAGDFANTVSYPESDTPHDWLVPYANVEAWIDAVDIDANVADTGALLEFRDAVRSILGATVDGDAPDATELDRVSAVLSERRCRERLTWQSAAGMPVWTADDTASLEVLVARSMMTVLTDEKLHSRLGTCGECKWVFLDETRNRSRRWCDPGDCGNRARQRRYIARHTDAR